MNRNLFTIFLFLFSIQANSQSITQTDSVISKYMKKFDVKHFNQNNKLGVLEETLENGDKVRCFEISSGYKKDVSSHDGIHSWHYEYDNEGYLYKKISKLYKMPVGNIYFYDRQGNVIKTEDIDKPFKFSLDDLRETMMRDFNVDIMDRKKMSSLFRVKLDRFNGETIYEVEYYLDNTRNDYHNILFNGETGEIIGEMKSTNPDSKPLSVYLESLEKKKAAESQKKKGWSFLD